MEEGGGLGEEGERCLRRRRVGRRRGEDAMEGFEQRDVARVLCAEGEVEGFGGLQFSAELEDGFGGGS